MIGRYKIIALCTCRIQDKESHNFIAMLNERLVEINCRLIIFNKIWVTNDDVKEDPQLSIFNLINSKVIDAVIIQADRFINYQVCEQIVKKSLEQSLPVISLGYSFDDCINIQYYHQSGFKDIIEHLIKHHKVRDFHMIAGEKNNKYSDERIEVFKETLKEYNIPVTDDMISFGDFWPIPAKKIAIRLMKENKLPRAFVCANDNMAIAVTEVLMQNGINVPNDVIVTGYDCIDEIYSLEPTITSAFISSKISAQVIFETVYDVLYHGKRSGIVSLNSKMVINESCGCESKEKINLTPYLNEQVSRFCQYQDDDIILAEITAKISLAKDEDDLCQILNNYLTKSLCVLLHKECVDSSKDPKIKLPNTFGNNMYMIYDSDSYNSGFKPSMVSFDYIMPNIERYLDDGRSIILTSLFYQGSTLGYTCFYFENHDISNYYKVPQIINSLNNGLGGLRNLIHNQYLIDHIAELYKTDALTGLYNRRGFLIEYEKFLKKNQGLSLTVIMCDLDGLKKINDTYGHEEGDIAIQKVAYALKECCPAGAIYTRFGGDEMLAVFNNDIADNDIYNSFEALLSNYNIKANKPYTVSASIGIYRTNPNEVLNFEELIKCSDKLMYENKAKKRK